MMNKTKFFVVTSVILLAAASRLLPHPPNVTPVAAMALFGGAYFSKKYLGFIVPLLIMFLSDLFIGLHNTIWAVYISFLIVTGLGILLRKKITAYSVVGMSLASSLIFFLITNMAVWMVSGWYPKTVGGLMECYTAAIPFFNNGIVGDLVFTTVLFGGYYFAKSKISSLSETI